MSKVLITGGAGFIGLHLAQRLAADGDQVDLLDNFSRGVSGQELKDFSTRKNVRLIEKDLLAFQALSDLDTSYDSIFHLAAIIGVANVLDRPYAVLTENVSMLKNILAFAKEQKALQRFIFASTSEVYAGTLRNFDLPVPTPEKTPLGLTSLEHPRTSYMLSKIYGEAMCHQSGVPFTIIRPHNLYGPRMGMSHVIPELLKKGTSVKNGGTIEVSSVDHTRAFCYIADAVQMIQGAAQSPLCVGQTLNIGNEDAEIAIGELAKLVFRILKKDLSITAKAPTPGSPTRRCPDMKQAIKLTGCKPQVNLEEGLVLTNAWYQENIFSGRDAGAR